MPSTFCERHHSFAPQRGGSRELHRTGNTAPPIRPVNRHRQAWRVLEISVTMTYIEFIEYLLKFDIDANARKRLLELPGKELARIREDYHVAHHQFGASILRLHANEIHTYAAAPTPYERVENNKSEFRPILHGRIGAAAHIFGGDAGHPWESADDAPRLNGLKRYLIYAHKLVLPDPLFYIMQFVPSTQQYARGEEESLFVAKSRIALANYLHFLHTVRGLVEAGIVSFYPQYEHTGVGFPSELFHDVNFCNWYERRAQRNPREMMLCEALHSNLIELLFYCRRYDATCLIEDQRLIPIFRSLLEYRESVLQNEREARLFHARAKERVILNRLGEATLPTLEGISLSDIVAVRQDGRGFGEWRKAFGDAILAVESQESDEASIREHVAYLLADGREKLNKEINKSSFLQKIKDQGSKLFLGSAAIGWGLGKIAEEVTSGAPFAIAAGSSALWVTTEWLKERSQRRSRAALLRHYTVWEQPDE
jgi:hypothetical protein